ncbi:MAG: hypothetical protein A2Y33_03695 [Spirochaetes bacterium GWF1_51_8]|nr:MAG: hypothetical protein A2Y33_03695 [Spirochaetes bacterium GWF1_51_8]
MKNIFLILLLSSSLAFSEEANQTPEPPAKAVTIGFDVFSLFYHLMFSRVNLNFETDIKINDNISLNVPFGFYGELKPDTSFLMLGINPKFYLLGNTFSGLWIGTRLDYLVLLGNQYYDALTIKTCVGYKFFTSNTRDVFTEIVGGYQFLFPNNLKSIGVLKSYTGMLISINFGIVI